MVVADGNVIDWLVEFKDLPPELARARRGMRARVTELFLQLGGRLNTLQRLTYTTACKTCAKT